MVCQLPKYFRYIISRIEKEGLTERAIILCKLNKSLLESSTSVAHFMYRILDSKKTTRFQFSIPGLRQIHRNLKQQKKNHIYGTYWFVKEYKPFCLCIPTDLELFNRLLLSLHSMIALFVYPFL